MVNEKINSWTFEETVKTAENLMKNEKNIFKWDVLRHLKDFAETYQKEIQQYRTIGTVEECRAAVEVIERFNYSNVFMYIDPPYVLGTRTGKQYKHEMSYSDHEELLKLLLQSKAKIMLSGYESEMYNDYLNGWEKKQFSSCAEHGKPRMETVWMNYEPDPQMKLNFSEVLS